MENGEGQVEEAEDLAHPSQQFFLDGMLAFADDQGPLPGNSGGI